MLLLLTYGQQSLFIIFGNNVYMVNKVEEQTIIIIFY